MKEVFCGFDTSNYTTSCAVCDYDGNVIANIKAPLPVRDGERGLRQSDAVFAHVKNLPGVTEKLAEATAGSTAVAVGVSQSPRRVSGSYMPVFLCGIGAAISFAAGAKAPLFGFSHQEGHVMAALCTSGALNEIDPSRFISFHVSGGTTEVLLCSLSGSDLSCERIGGTTDLNAGRLIDRTGVRLGLSFPCGAELDRLCMSVDTSVQPSKTSVNGTECSLSGLENVAISMIEKKNSAGYVARFIFDSVCETLIKLTRNARGVYGNLPVIFSGGVTGSAYISSRLSGLDACFFTSPEYSSDNAVGIALLARLKYLNEN